MLEVYRNQAYFEASDGPGYSSYLAQEHSLRGTFASLIRELQIRGLARGRLLEVGCAYGFFLDEAEQFFDERIGTDFSAHAAEIARTRADRIYVGGIEELGDEGRFDLVAMIHTIEHIYDPLAMIRKVRRLLAPGGAVLLAAPDMGWPWRHLMGRRWPFFKVPEHVSFFDRHSLHRLLADAGLDEIRPLPYRSAFSLELIGEKLGLRLPRFARTITVPMPATTVAAIGREPSGKEPRP